MADDVVAFLRAALDEVERVAFLVPNHDGPGGAWTFTDDGYDGEIRDDNDELVDDGECQSAAIPYLRQQALHDPRAALARVQAERAVLSVAERRAGIADEHPGSINWVAWSDLEDVLRHLAYGHRHTVPGYDPAWAPEGVSADA